jgi:glycosyltransferase involved in cell wall biosynthesis
MKRVAHFIDSDDPGGAETLIIQLCRSLDEYGYCPEVWHLGNPWLVEQCRRHNIVCRHLPGRRLYKSIKTLPLFVLFLSAAIRRHKINLLHSHLVDAVASGAIAAFLARVPHVGTLHDVYSLVEDERKLRLLRMASFLRTKVVAVSAQIKTTIERSNMCKGEMIEVIPNGTDLDEFSRNVPWHDVRSSLGIRYDEVVLISVGRLVSIKGFENLIEAVGRLLSDGVLAKLLIVGDGPDRSRYEELIRGKALSASIRLLGQREDVSDLLRSSDCFVLASRSEGLSCSIIEAMAAGLPVVATDVGGNSELVQEGVSGYLVPYGDLDVLVSRLKQIVVDADRRIQLGQAGADLAAQRFSLKGMVARYVALYEPVCDAVGNKGSERRSLCDCRHDGMS